jgi:hypothetical protein
MDMNNPDTKGSSAHLAGILQMMSMRGYEIEFKRNLYHADLILGHLQPLPSEIFMTLQENGFEYRFLDKVAYTDADGAIRCRSHFRRSN